jgi:hypothetical protein
MGLLQSTYKDKRFAPLAREERKHHMTTTAAPAKPATDKQVAFINSLLSDRNVPEVIGAGILAGMGTLTTRNASALIKGLLELPARETVAAGRYFVNVDGSDVTYRISYGKGSWSGWTFVNRLDGEEWTKVKGEAAKAIINAVTLDPRPVPRKGK